MPINQYTHDLFGRESAFSGCITSFEGKLIRLFGADHGRLRRIKKADRCQLRLGGTRAELS